MYMNVFTDGNRIFTTGDFMNSKEELATEKRRLSMFTHLGEMEFKTQADKKPASKKKVS